MPRPAEVFISYAARNRGFVKTLTRMLADHGVRAWYSERHIRGAQQWHDEIGRALKRCDWFLLVLSPQAVASKWVKRELLYALQDDRYEQRIIPVVFRRCDFDKLSWTLSSFQVVDFRGGFDAGCPELLRVWRVRYTGIKTHRLPRSGKARRR